MAGYVKNPADISLSRVDGEGEARGQSTINPAMILARKRIDKPTMITVMLTSSAVSIQSAFGLFVVIVVSSIAESYEPMP